MTGDLTSNQISCILLTNKHLKQSVIGASTQSENLSHEKMKPEDKNWLMQQIALLTTDVDSANFGIDTSRCDLEIIIQVAEKDRDAFTDEVLASLKQELATRTSIASPVVYLEGNEPEWLAKGD